MVTPHEFIAKYQQRGMDANKFYKEGVVRHFQSGRIVTGSASVISIFIILGGYRLYKKERKIHK